jgi:hypothetical protein
MSVVKWLRITQNQYLGFFALGLAFFILQELPYIIMPLISLAANPLMEMADKSAVLNIAEKALGVSSIIALLFFVRGDAKWFSLSGTKEIVFFCAAMLAIAGYFAGWALYFNGYQGVPLILCTLVALPPVYYAFIGLWRGNYVLAAIGGLFLIAHLANVWNNLR